MFIITVFSSNVSLGLVVAPTLAGLPLLADVSTEGGPTRGPKPPVGRSGAGKTIFIYHGVKIKTIAIKPKARRVFLFIYLGSGSAPPSVKGWHLKILFIVKAVALTKEKVLKAAIP